MHIQRYRGQWPRIAEEAITLPLFITGLSRTGTTLLYGLLAVGVTDRPHRRHAARPACRCAGGDRGLRRVVRYWPPAPHSSGNAAPERPDRQPRRLNEVPVQYRTGRSEQPIWFCQQNNFAFARIVAETFGMKFPEPTVNIIGNRAQISSCRARRGEEHREVKTDN